MKRRMKAKETKDARSTKQGQAAAGPDTFREKHNEVRA